MPFSIEDELESLVDMFAAQSHGSGVDVTLDLAGKQYFAAQKYSSRGQFHERFTKI